MSRTRTVAVTVVIETADPRLDPETIDASTAATARAEASWTRRMVMGDPF